MNRLCLIALVLLAAGCAAHETSPHIAPKPISYFVHAHKNCDEIQRERDWNYWQLQRAGADWERGVLARWQLSISLPPIAPFLPWLFPIGPLEDRLAQEKGEQRSLEEALERYCR